MPLPTIWHNPVSWTFKEKALGTGLNMAGKCSGFLASRMIGKIREYSSQSGKRLESFANQMQCQYVRDLAISWYVFQTCRNSYNFLPRLPPAAELTLLALVTGFSRPCVKREFFPPLPPVPFLKHLAPVICLVEVLIGDTRGWLCHCFGFIFTKCNRSLLCRDSLRIYMGT